MASVVLKRFSDALIDKDPILGLISGTATNHSADAVSITHPHAPTQESLFRKVLADSGISNPYEINYVEMHGTGTQAGDAVEMESVLNVFAPSHRTSRRKDQTLYLGALKPNIGHGEAVSGISSLIKVLMMLRKDGVPPNVGVKNLNRNFPSDLVERNVVIPRSYVRWPRSGQSRKVFLNNFSAAGGNTSYGRRRSFSTSQSHERTGSSRIVLRPLFGKINLLPEKKRKEYHRLDIGESCSGTCQSFLYLFSSTYASRIPNCHYCIIP